MRFFLKNLEMIFNFRIILIIFACILVNVFYSYENFPQVLYGVEGSFNLLTAIPWIATVFPYFIGTGAYFSAMDENSIFVLSRIKKSSIYYMHFVFSIIFSAIIYCLFYVILAWLFGGDVFEILLCGVLICINLILVAGIQWMVYSFKKSVMASLFAVLFIIIFPLIFYKNNLNIGAWAMLIKFHSFFVCLFEIALTAILNCVVIFFEKFGRRI